METVCFSWPYPAKSVLLAGDFNEWTPTPMIALDSSFYLNVRLAVGFDYSYKFVVDGDWRVLDGLPTKLDENGNLNNSLIFDGSLSKSNENQKHSKQNRNQKQPKEGQNESATEGDTTEKRRNAPESTTEDDATEKRRKGPNTNKGKRGRNEKKGIIETEPTMGTRDFYPEDMRLRNWLFSHFRNVALKFAFQEYDAPILESEELYKRKAGEEITAQMYNFHSKDGTDVTLRPEMTPTLARLILKAGRKMLLPIKWFSIPQCWRYETTTRGRMREHYQWNMDIVGVASVTAEAELLAAIVSFFKAVGLTSADVVIKVNSRQVLQAVLAPLGITEDLFAPVCVIVDKLDKLSSEEVEKQLTDLKLNKTIIETIQSTLTIKDLKALKKVLPSNSPVIAEFDLLWKIAREYGYDDWLLFDASIVRGLAYYTGIVFECRDRAGNLRAITGGGRYNRLLTTYGSKEEVPACGFGFGDCVIIELLKDKNLLPNLTPEIEDLVIAFNEDLRGPACKVANKLREKNRRVDVQLIPNKPIKWCYNYADRVGATRAIFVAPDEWGKGLVRVKLLRSTDSEKEFDIPFSEL